MTEAKLAVLGAVLIAGQIALLPPARLGFERLCARVQASRNVFFARWGFVDLVKVLLVGLVLAFGVQHLPFPEGVLGDLLRTVAILQGMAILCHKIAVRSEPTGARALGFESRGAVRAVVAGVFLYLALWPGLAGLTLVSPWLVDKLGGVFELQQALDVLALEGGARLFAFALVVLLIPLLEEVLFRGFLQPLLVQNLREVGGVAMTSLLFAALHGQSAFFAVFGLSCVLGACQLRTQRIYASFAVHALHNASVLFLHLRYPEIQQTFS